MEKPKKANPMKNITKLITDTSQRFLSSFLDDTLIKKREQENIKQIIKEAIALKCLIVLQLSEGGDKPVSTVYGKTKENPRTTDIILLVEENSKNIKMIPIDTIKKISMMEHSKNKIAR